jgi:hypothetical protein
MATLTKPQIDALTLEEKLKLIDDLEESLLDVDELPTPDWHLPLIQARIKAHEANPQPTRSWASVKAEMEEKWLA